MSTPEGPKEKEGSSNIGFLPQGSPRPRQQDSDEVGAVAQKVIRRLQGSEDPSAETVLIDGDEGESPIVQMPDGFVAGTRVGLAIAKAARRESGKRTVAGEVEVLPGHVLVHDPDRNTPIVRKKDPK